MLDGFKSLNGHASKQEWIELFKFYVPTFKPSGDFDRFDTEITGIETVELPIAHAENR